MKSLLTLALTVLPTFGFAHDYNVGDLVIEHPVARETTANAMAGAGYFMITNNGDTDDVLLEVRADFPRVMIHDTEVTDGVATMIHLDNLPIPAGESVELVRGGKHVMFMGLNGDPLESGEEIPAVLVFENAGEVEIMFNVETMKEGHNH